MFSACRSSILTAVLSGTWHGVSRLCRESSRFWVWFWVIFLFTASWLSFSIMASVETVCCVERHFMVNSSSFTKKKKNWKFNEIAQSFGTHWVKQDGCFSTIASFIYFTPNLRLRIVFRSFVTYTIALWLIQLQKFCGKSGCV